MALNYPLNNGNAKALQKIEQNCAVCELDKSETRTYLILQSQL